MTTATIVNATVKYAAGKVITTKHGNDRINVVLTLADGGEATIWGNPGDTALTSLRKGDAVQALFDGKGYKLVEVPQQSGSASSAPPAAPQSTTVDADDITKAKRAIASDITVMADLYGFCYGEAKRVLEPHGATTEGIQGCAFRLWHHAKDQGLSAP